MRDGEIGIIVNGATGGICNRQHLERALKPIIQEGGVWVRRGRVVPRLILIGRNEARLAEVARRHGVDDWTTDLDAALADKDYAIFFDASISGQREALIGQAIAAGKHVYVEKPAVLDRQNGRKLAAAAEAKGLKHGVVQDKLSLPGLVKLAYACRSGALGRILSFRLDFGYWIFSGFDLPMQRPSWNYREEAGGGLLRDMYPHWRYVIEGLLGPIERVVATAWTAVPRRIDEHGRPYDVDVDDSNITIAQMASGARGVITSSWATRVRRDDLLTIQVDGTEGSAVAGLHRCWTQPRLATPKVAFNPDVDLQHDYCRAWTDVPDAAPRENGYRKGWENFIRHVVDDGWLGANLSAGLRDIELADACIKSVESGRWVDMSPMPDSLRQPGPPPG